MPIKILKNPHCQSDPRTSWLPVAMGIGLIALTITFWQALLANERRQVAQIVEGRVEHVTSIVSEFMDERILALIRMAERWEMRNGTPRGEWEADAANYVDDSPGYQAIEWVDPSFHVRWVIPVEGNEQAFDIDLAFEDRRRIALEKARDRDDVTVTRALDLVQGGKGFLVYVPLFVDNRFDGFILGVFRFEELMRSALQRIAGAVTDFPYSVAIYDGDEEIYRQDVSTTSNQAENRLAYDKEMRVGDVVWRLRLEPTANLVDESQSVLPEFVLAIGLTMSALITGTVYLAQTAHQNARLLSATNHRLEREIDVRRKTEEELTALAESLERRVAKRTADSEKRAQELARVNAELERFNRLAVGREQRMIELKQQINELSAAAGKQPPHALKFLEAAEA